MTTKWRIDTWPRTFLGRIGLTCSCIVLIGVVTRGSPRDTRDLVAYSFGGIVVLALMELGARVACWAQFLPDSLVVRTGSGRVYKKTVVPYWSIQEVNLVGRQVAIVSNDSPPLTLKFTMNQADKFVEDLNMRRTVS